MNQIRIDPSDYSSLLKLMDDHEKYDSTYIGKNDEGETIFITILEDSITLRTFQDNGWIRENIFWRDFTTEEIFDGKWNRKEKDDDSV